MTAQTIVCGACAGAVPHGRLSCPACGELLASVAGGSRRNPIARVAPPTPPTLMVDPPLSPGSYVPPMSAAPAVPFVPAVPAVPVVTAVPAGTAAPARAWGTTGHPPAGMPNDSRAADGMRVARRPSHASHVREASTWLAVAGSALALAGFLLPWASSVIGARGVGYFDRWGLAGPGHWLIAIALLVVLALGILANPVPNWIRSGVAGMILGALSIGLTWPYLFALPGAQAGALIIVAGAALLLLAGVAAIATDRHARTDRPV